LKVFGFYIIWRLLRGGFGAGVRRWGRKQKRQEGVVSLLPLAIR